MYTLVVGHSTSPNYSRAISLIIEMGGFYNQNHAILKIEEEIKAYFGLFPLFSLRVFTWKNTKAYHNGKPVDPYRFVFLANLNRGAYYREVCRKINKPSTVFTYYRREGNVFFFKKEDYSFSREFRGKALFDFIDKYNINDKVILK